MKEWMNIGRMALQFFTVLPAAKTVEWTERRAARTICLLPFIGMGIAGVLFLLLFIFTKAATSGAVVSLLVFLACIGMTGGLHLDGWMDVSDAYFSRRERGKKLEILSDPHIGSFAVLSLLFLLAIRWASIYELLLKGEVTWSMLAVILVLPRLMAGWFLLSEQTAKKTGLASYFQQGVTPSLRNRYVVQSVLFIVFFFFMAENKVIMFVIVGLMVVFGSLYRAFIRKQFGGITGDTIGAAIEGGETWLWMSFWLLHVFVTG
ncbi:adenosylcobinamide-GDP ribazoletransferase [Bacillus songklensis]|uniref:Adenosylcobinamide-GDP ribazoletransferase n=1 Tax=Bacillus songklensis TaxID=1069116 RepID=A0ABV8AX85_9BACI